MSCVKKKNTKGEYKTGAGAGASANLQNTMLWPRVLGFTWIRPRPHGFDTRLQISVACTCVECPDYGRCSAKHISSTGTHAAQYTIFYPSKSTRWLTRDCLACCRFAFTASYLDNVTKWNLSSRVIRGVTKNTRHSHIKLQPRARTPERFLRTVVRLPAAHFEASSHLESHCLR